MNERSKGYTWMQTILGTFAVLAYFIGGILGNMVLIYVGAAITLLAAIIPALLIEEPRVLNNVSEETNQNQLLPEKTSSCRCFRSPDCLFIHTLPLHAGRLPPTAVLMSDKQICRPTFRRRWARQTKDLRGFRGEWGRGQKLFENRWIYRRTSESSGLIRLTSL